VSQAGGICVLVRRRLIAARRPVNLVQLDHLEPEAGDPEHEPGEGGLIWQHRTERRGIRAYGYLTVVKFLA
jgi:hypothetical protein